jgi:hypothetical protein
MVKDERHGRLLSRAAVYVGGRDGDLQRHGHRWTGHSPSWSSPCLNASDPAAKTAATAGRAIEPFFSTSSRRSTQPGPSATMRLA